MGALPEQRKGELYVVSAGAIFGLFPVLVVLTYDALSSLASLAWSTLFATLFFAVLIVYRGRWRELTNPAIWKHGALITLFIGVLFYGFYFFGLEHTSPGNAAIIVLFQVFTAFLFFNVFRKENISTGHKLGAILMVIGAVVVLGRNFSGINIGDVLILIATFFTPFGNYFQQQAREFASSETIMFVRSVLSTIVLFPVMYAWNASAELADVREVLLFLLASGILVLGLEKVLWIEAIHRISVTKAQALGSISPFFALIFVWLFLGQFPTLWQLLSLLPFTLGVLLLTDQLTLKRG